MIRAILVPGKGLDAYSSAATGRRWLPGEVREVAPSVFTYLTSTFPDAFVEHKDEPEPKAAKKAHPAPEPDEKPEKTTRRG